jgi:hypothetical protein
MGERKVRLENSCIQPTSPSFEEFEQRVSLARTHVRTEERMLQALARRFKGWFHRPVAPVVVISEEEEWQALIAAARQRDAAAPRPQPPPLPPPRVRPVELSNDEEAEWQEAIRRAKVRAPLIPQPAPRPILLTRKKVPEEQLWQDAIRRAKAEHARADARKPARASGDDWSGAIEAAKRRQQTQAAA